MTMAKKAKARKAQAPYSEDRVAIRLYVLPAEHTEIRLAAARRGVPMSEFCRQASTEAARKENAK
jgi:hypothetical protein